MFLFLRSFDFFLLLIYIVFVIKLIKNFFRNLGLVLIKMELISCLIDGLLL